MGIHELAIKAAEMARDVKEKQMIDASADGDTDINAVVFGFRGEVPIVTMMPFEMSRDHLIHTAQICAVAFGCDTIATTNEGYHSLPPHTEQNPLTGEHWGPGEMQEAAVEHDGVAKGWVTESLTTMVVNRAGDVTMIVQDYKIHTEVKSGKLHDQVFGGPVTLYRVEWTETLDSEMATGVGGTIPEALVTAMNLPTLQQTMLRDKENFEEFSQHLTPVQMQAHQDCAIVKFLPEMGWVGGILLIADSPERQAVITRSLEGWMPGDEI